MRKFLRKNWIHLLFWISLGLYLSTAPYVYAGYFLKSGKPVQFNQGLPASTNLIRFDVQNLDAITSNGQELFRLYGWSFFSGDKDQSSFDQYIVLKSGAKTYYFPAKFEKRPELPVAFPDVNINLFNSGFSTSISKHSIMQGVYQIGILFRQKTSSAVYYTDTNYQITRTPNQVKFEKIKGQKVKFNQQIPVLTSQVRFAVSRLDPVPPSKNVYNLWGWSFFTGDSDQSKYERIVVLQSETNTYLYPIKSFERPGVQETFKYLNMDLLNSGFSTNLSASDITPGTYHLGLLFKNRSNNLAYYMLTDKIIISTVEKLELQQ